MKYIITGSAGFVGFHLSRRLLAEGHCVRGFDSFNSYYDPSLKRARNAILAGYPDYQLIEGDLADRDAVERLFAERPDCVIHLAAQAGVRYSLDHPEAYVSSNLSGFLNVLEQMRRIPGVHLVFASSSSVYGANTKTPFAETDFVDNPVSFYAATKKSNELMAHCYAHLFGIPSSGLRFFTVYGPMGRPDMAYYKFTKAIFEGRTIDVYNNGDMMRDFTYIDDIVEGVIRVAAVVPQRGDSPAPYAIYNLGNHRPVRLSDFIQMIEELTGRDAVKNYLPMQPGDVYATYADITRIQQSTGWKPVTEIRTGLTKFIDWYRAYYGVS